MAIYYKGKSVGNVLVDLPSFSNVCEQKVAFTDWHNGTSEESLVAFPHNLGVKPSFVALVADDMSAIETVEMPSGINTLFLQVDAARNIDTDTLYYNTYIRRNASGVGAGSYDTTSGLPRMISKWDDKYIYVNSNASGAAWVPESVSTYTMITACDSTAKNVTMSMSAGEVVDNSICKIQAIEFSFGDWFTADSGARTIPHSLGADPDTVIILPSHYEWNPADYYDGYYGDFTVCARLVRSYNFAFSEYSATEVEYYKANEEGYYTKLIGGDVITWNESKVNIQPLGDMVFAPKSEITYKLLVIKHT